MSIGGLPALNDGNNARAQLYNQIIADGVQIVISAGNNGNALNTIGDPSVATDVVSVGASISKATWKANYGSDVAFDKNMLTFSSGGPREDGGFKPNITAPGSAISTTPTWQPGDRSPRPATACRPATRSSTGRRWPPRRLPVPWRCCISAGKARGVSTTPAQLRQAVYSTAGYNSTVPCVPAGSRRDQRAGRVDLLAQNLRPDTFTVSAPVCTEIWKILGETPGTGIYNRCAAGQGGHAVGQKRNYTVTVTRTSGARRAGPTRSRCAGTTAPTRCRRRRSPCR